MKDFITPLYTFTPGAAGVGNVNLYGIEDFDIARLVAMINQTTGTLIYSTASNTLGYTSVVGTVVTLSASTSTMASTDEIQIIYADPASTMDLIVMLNNLYEVIASPGIRDKTQNADRVVVAAALPTGTNSIGNIGTVTTVTTVSTVSALTTMTNMGTLASQLYPGHMQVVQNNQNAWANTCRRLIS